MQLTIIEVNIVFTLIICNKENLSEKKNEGKENVNNCD